jgi:hypothetical protein
MFSKELVGILPKLSSYTYVIKLEEGKTPP